MQSSVSEHSELGWILNTITPIGELERMTQFKDKSQKQKSVLAGLLNYPVLQAADILLYHTNTVPVGEDQLQHIEITRAIARKFNSTFGETFAIPEPFINKEGKRIMGLDDPAKKMSKSAENSKNYIALLDSPEIIREKIKSAVTDSENEIKYDAQNKPAVSNLLTIYGLFSGKSLAVLEKEYVNKNYSIFKNDLAEVITNILSPIQNKYKELSANPDYVKSFAPRRRKSQNNRFSNHKRSSGKNRLFGIVIFNIQEKFLYSFFSRYVFGFAAKNNFAFV